MDLDGQSKLIGNRRLHTDYAERYRLVPDDDGNLYAIPESKESEWYSWLEDQENENYDPEWAMLVIEGTFSFLDPRIE